jgi:hypothetical protein
MVPPTCWSNSISRKNGRNNWIAHQKKNRGYKQHTLRGKIITEPSKTSHKTVWKLFTNATIVVLVGPLGWPPLWYHPPVGAIVEVEKMEEKMG